MGNLCGRVQTFSSRRRRLREPPPIRDAGSSVVAPLNLKTFTLEELETATRNFHNDLVLSEGGFGTVYKGWVDGKASGLSILGEDSLPVAVKKLRQDSYQGDEEWLAEIKYSSRVHHENIVKLLGYCSEEEKRILVYEHMHNGSLNNHLFKENGEPISWDTRIKIAIDVACVLVFLHSLNNPIIFRDLKSSDVLLGPDFKAKISDFGLAKTLPDADEEAHLSTRVMGTYGYAAPEYVMTGQLTLKCDVYSFGILLLELISARRAWERSGGSRTHIVDWAKPLHDEKSEISRIVDARLEGQYPKEQGYAVSALALLCANTDPKCRPTMKQVLTTLEQLQ